MSKSKGISKDKIMVKSLRPEEKINRRELLKLFLPPAITKGLRDKPGNSLSPSEDGIARCRECGNVIGSRAMIDRLQAKLQAMGGALAFQLEICSTCKTEQLSLGRAALELNTSQGRTMESLEEG